MLTEISANFQLYEMYNTIQKYEFNTTFDLIFFDAFDKLVKTLNRVGVLVTYCAKWEVKRILISLGVQVKSLVGLPGKREMIRAIRL